MKRSCNCGTIEQGENIGEYPNGVLVSSTDDMILHKGVSGGIGSMTGKDAKESTNKPQDLVENPLF